MLLLIRFALSWDLRQMPCMPRALHMSGSRCTSAVCAACGPADLQALAAKQTCLKCCSEQNHTHLLER